MSAKQGGTTEQFRPSGWAVFFLFPRLFGLGKDGGGPYALTEGRVHMLERLFHPGTLLVVIGAVLVYGSGKIAGRFFPGKEQANAILKGAGCALAVIGALLLFATT